MSTTPERTNAEPVGHLITMTPAGSQVTTHAIDQIRIIGRESYGPGKFLLKVSLLVQERREDIPVPCAYNLTVAGVMSLKGVARITWDKQEPLRLLFQSQSPGVDQS